MRAVVCRAWGPPEALVVEDLPAPTPGAGEALVRVRACGVNFADALIVQGEYQGSSGSCAGKRGAGSC